MLDPFCGVGTVVALANAMGLDSTGVEVSAKRVRKAKVRLLPFITQYCDVDFAHPCSPGFGTGIGGSGWTYARTWRAWT